MVDERRIADEVLDYLVYAPVGALLTLVEDLPALANKGRSRVQGRLMVARSLGLFAVQIGQRRVQSVVKERVGSVRPGGKAPAPAGPAGDVEPEADTVDIGAKGAAARGGRPVGGTVSKPVVTRPPKHVPARGRGGRVGEEQVPAGTPLTVGGGRMLSGETIANRARSAAWARDAQNASRSPRLVSMEMPPTLRASERTSAAAVPRSPTNISTRSSTRWRASRRRPARQSRKSP